MPIRGFSDFRTAVTTTRVLVVGDVMLDRYWFGDVERISPEAPVPVVRISRSEERPGGAANVARNVAALGAQATLISVIGDDEPGRSLERLLGEEHVRTSFHRDSRLPACLYRRFHQGERTTREGRRRSLFSCNRSRFPTGARCTG